MESTVPADAALDHRVATLRAAGASGAVVDELLAYGTSLAAASKRAGAPIPDGDEPHVAVWREYADEAASRGAIEALRPRFAQLSCPIEAGISQTPEYRAATRQGRFEDLVGLGRRLALAEPDGIVLTLEPTMAGQVPILVAGVRADFEALVRALTARNEPEAIPASAGACLVSGLINWDRVARYRAAWEASDAAKGADWSAEFKRMAADKAAYQDRLILLSRGPYSNIDTDEADWLERSLVIRREHECAHYFTWRVFGTIRTHVFDELLADFVGLVRAYGRYPGALARRFLGIDADGRRLGGRLDNYRGSPPVSDPAFDVLAVLAARATATLERTWAASGASNDLPTLRDWSWALCHLPLDALAADDFAARHAAAGRPPARSTP
jgi:hypothetical protein